MSAVDRRQIFQAVKALRNGQGFTMAEVQLLDAAIDAAVGENEAVPVSRAPAPEIAQPPGRQMTVAGLDLMRQFEGCELAAYPDPGSADGNPWTIGYGATGDGIRKGVVWTQDQCDQRFAADVAAFAARVDKAIGEAPTTGNQFSAMVALAFNIGIVGFRGSTVLRKHKAGDYLGAARAFVMWNKNDGQVMRGLTRRRLAESELYSKDDA